MSTEVIVALLSLMGTLVGSLTGIIVSNKLVNYRLDSLEKRVDNLCKLTERVAVVEADVKNVANYSPCPPPVVMKQ